MTGQSTWVYPRGMTKTQENTEETIHLSPLMANILTANAKWSEDLTNRVMDNKDREIAEWKSAFRKLFDAVDFANESVDSMKIDRILGTFAQKRGWAVPEGER